MQFGGDKCAYLQIEKGQIMQNFEPIFIKSLTVKLIGEGNNCKYLGIDENTSYNAPINRERVIKGYVNLTKNIWNFQLSDFNKADGILDWTCKGIGQRHVVFIPTTILIGYRLCFSRKDGGRGIRAIKATYKIRRIS